MTQTVELGSVIQREDGTYHISLPGYGEVTLFLGGQEVTICSSCHRELTDMDETANADSPVCPRCYVA